MNDGVLIDDASAEALMGQIIDEFLERQQRGERPEFEEYARRYPQFADVLRQLLPALGLLHESAADDPVEASPSAAGIIPEGSLGDYRLVREIGRGGMGVVYEAVQISLGRRVALKILPFAAALNARQLLRFKNEAHAAAQLQHQNIVPVYGVGCERGVHYYAMQLIDGQTLAAVIADLRRLIRGAEEERQSLAEPMASDLLSGKWLAEPGRGEQTPTEHYVPRSEPHLIAERKEEADSDRQQRKAGTAPDTVRRPEAALSTENSTGNPAFFRSVAQLGIQAARALEHSHNLGVFHRDIKPTNLLLDARGNLWITDFGLAHVHNDTKLTLTGDIMGTLRYMSPEQALAQRVVLDHRTDLYSLGATLYELLTLEPVFTGNERRELMRQIAFEEPRRPRQLNKTIPLELETIVLKALEKNPAERYATAKEMADDLERFLKDEPIRAKQPSLVRRVRKWSRRHRPLVASAIVATVTVVAIAIAALGLSLAKISVALSEKSVALTVKSKALDREKETTYLQSIALAERELAAGNVGRAEELLDACPEHLRGWEWHFLKRQHYGDAPTLKHPATIVRVAFSPDGRQLATVCMDGSTRAGGEVVSAGDY
jgi:serine/threonine protein kinase